MESSRRIVVIMIILTAHASLLGGQGSDPVWLSSEKKEMIHCDLKAKATVSLDGTGDHRTITEAPAAVPENNVSPYVIHVKEGVYKENVKVSKKHVVMFGDGSHKTVVVGNMSRVDFPDLATFETATFSVLRDNFVVKDMMFRNVAGPEKHQAVAFHSKSSFFRDHYATTATFGTGGNCYSASDKPIQVYTRRKNRGIGARADEEGDTCE
ncbi:PREDICTED: pectinesterase 2.2-like [Camelina sativa]|uniref:Pectinesterase n=1 Tax=Camelina sativa TaxID=90675 RepID=A0ABM0WAM9_CAMSA|nr:PREDICTED: pectinesterase 2.2-like [Camelina sativa]